jgi:DNA-binding PadR family transcriptional regulator
MSFDPESIASRIERVTSWIVLLPGSLYNTIARMVRDGLIDEVAASDEGDPRKRYYRATELGRTVARAESARLRTLLELAEEQNLAGRARA